MFLLHLLLLFNILLPAISAPNLSRAIARIGEARARALSNRARIRANNARIMNQMGRSSGSPRSKRQDNFGDPYEENEEPIHLHICSTDDDRCVNLYRSSEIEESQPENSLDRALQKMMDAEVELEKIKDESRSVQSRLRAPPNDEIETKDAHIFHPSHAHSHSLQHGRHQSIVPGLNIDQNQGLHIATVEHSNIHQTIHQPGLHQSGLHQSGLHQSVLHQSVVPGTVPLHTSSFSQIPPVHGSTIFPFTRLRKAQEDEFGGSIFLPNFSPDMIGSEDTVANNEKIEPYEETNRWDSENQMSFINQNENWLPEEEETREPVLDSLHEKNEEDTLREANPSLDKLEKLRELKLKKLEKLLPELLPTYESIYENPYQPGYGENSAMHSFPGYEEDSREADATLHKLKRKKMQKLQPQYHQAYPVSNNNHYTHYNGHFRESEDDKQPIVHENEDIREADPTHHKIKKLKQKKMQKFQPQYYPNYHTNPYGQFYRNTEDSEIYEKDFLSNDDSLRSPNLFSFPARSKNDFYRNNKRSTDQQLDKVLRQQRKIVDTLHNNSKNDEDLKLVVNIANRTLTDVENQRKKITKRSIPLTRLISDPSVKLDVPKTFENFGTATKNVFEDEKAPMYHFKHLVGSSKNAILSAMRIPPQNMIIPSDYEIVKMDNYVGSSNPRLRSRSRQDPEDPLGFSRTFNRVGEMVRESIKSGQDTATHIGQVAHDARNMIHSARHSAPRLIVPYAHMPAVQDTRRRTPSKAILITPRLLDLAHEENSRKRSDSRADFVRLGHLMDAVGISKPNSKSLDLQKIIFEPRRLSHLKADERLAQMYSRLRESLDNDADTVGEAINTLEDAKISVGAKDLRDLLIKMRSELTSMVHNTPKDHKRKKYKSKKKKQQETKEMGIFIEKLFDGNTEGPENETVGAGLYLPPGLLQPFMGSATQSQVHDFLKENGDDLGMEKPQHKNKSPNEHYQHHFNHNNENGNHTDSLGYVLGAINPLMLERMYNHTVHIKGNDIGDPETLFKEGTNVEDGGTVGTFAVNGPMLKPFMGEVQPEAIEKFLDTYNQENENSMEKDK